LSGLYVSVICQGCVLLFVRVVCRGYMPGLFVGVVCHCCLPLLFVRVVIGVVC